MSKDENIEHNLLSGESIDAIIKRKIDAEIKKELEDAESMLKKVVITDFSLLPVCEIFAKTVTYSVFNRKTKQQSYINGVQAEGLIGLQAQTREKLIRKEIDSFLTDDYYVKFKSAVLVGLEGYLQTITGSGKQVDKKSKGHSV